MVLFYLNDLFDLNDQISQLTCLQNEFDPLRTSVFLFSIILLKWALVAMVCNPVLSQQLLPGLGNPDPDIDKAEAGLYFLMFPLMNLGQKHSKPV